MTMLRPVFIACLVSVPWPGYDCLWLASGPLYGLFESVIAE